ncbi:MAG: chemotaxis-specific protein-glutamate methyltransferase CheB [Polyangia bacterium]
MTKLIRVLVVEDSLTVRARIVEVLRADPTIIVVGECGDGRDAIEQCRLLRPDVVTLDMMLPIMTGVAVTEYIMAYFPTPILIVSASTNRGELHKTYEALAAGALAVLDKPGAHDDSNAWAVELVSTVRLVSRIKVITHPRAKLYPPLPAFGTPGLAAPRLAGASRSLVVIGASTGGPAAVEVILSSLPADFPIPILLVIHIAKTFGSAFADWLDGQVRIPVRDAVDGEPLPRPGTPGVIMAPPDVHLVVRDRKLRLTKDAPVFSCRPSVDMLFGSVAAELGREALGMLLTGMGRDGAEGLLAMRKRGALTVAQDEATSVIFGMPREAILLGAAEQILPLDQMAPLLLTHAHGREC